MTVNDFKLNEQMRTLAFTENYLLFSSSDFLNLLEDVLG